MYSKAIFNIFLPGRWPVEKEEICQSTYVWRGGAEDNFVQSSIQLNVSTVHVNMKMYELSKLLLWRHICTYVLYSGQRRL